MNFRCSDFVKYFKNRRFFPSLPIAQSVKMFKFFLPLCVQTSRSRATKTIARNAAGLSNGITKKRNLSSCCAENVDRGREGGSLPRVLRNGNRGSTGQENLRTRGVLWREEDEIPESKQRKGSRHDRMNKQFLIDSNIDFGQHTYRRHGNENNNRNLGLTWSPLALIAQPIH